MARCPAHDDREPSLAIRDRDDGTVLVYCHAGCSQERVIAALRSRGQWRANERTSRRAGPISAPAGGKTARSSSDRNLARRTEAALALWRAARPAEGSPIERYLASRGLHLAAQRTLRFHPRLKHPTGGMWPAMIALVTRGADDTPIAVHRTFLSRDGKAKAPVEPQKMMLGPCRGGAVRLGVAGDTVMIGEGIETCLAAMQATGEPVWAALSTSGLRSLELPQSFRDIVVLADGDVPGEAAARAAAGRWTREGRRVRIARPPAGSDFNDLLQRGFRGATS
jgi:DNA primase